MVAGDGTSLAIRSRLVPVGVPIDTQILPSRNTLSGEVREVRLEGTSRVVATRGLVVSIGSLVGCPSRDKFEVRGRLERCFTIETSGAIAPSLG